MTGVLDGVVVLDLSTGIAGPVAGMLLADHGAQVTKVEPPGGDPTRAFSGAQVWHRGKRSAVLDPRRSGRSRACRWHSHRTPTWSSRTSRPASPRSSASTTTRCSRATRASCTARSPHTATTARTPTVPRSTRWSPPVPVTSGRAAAFPAARSRAWPGVAPAFPDLVVPDDCWVAAPRPGPLHSGVPWVSMASAYLATLAISAALRVREQTGRGQRVSTSLFQGVLATTLSAWQRVEHVDTPNYQSWISDPRAPKGVFRCADGRWIHQWVPLPDFVISAAEGDRLQRTEKTTRPRDATTRIGMDVNEMLLLHHYQPLMAAAIAKFPAEPWVELGAEVGVPLQPLRSPEEALHDPAFLADGCVIEVDDPELGAVRQVGRVYDLHVCPTAAPAAPAAVGAHTDAVRAEADASSGATPAARTTTPAPASPLAGVRVVDLGLAVAGPWGTMMLADLGAEVIKVNPLHDFYWMSTHIAMACNRGKRSIAMNLKDPAAMAILHELVATADVVQHNMRYDAAVRLGVDYESLQAIKPDLDLLPHARLRARRARRGCPATTRPVPRWPDPTGSTAASITTASRSGRWCRWATPATASSPPSAWCRRSTTGTAPARASSSTRRSCTRSCSTRRSPGAWPTAAGTATVPASTPCSSVTTPRNACTRPPTAGCASPRSPTSSAARWRRCSVSTRSVTPPRSARWSRRSAPAARRSGVASLDAAGVPSEVSSPDFVLGLFDDPEMIDKGWVTKYRHPIVGDMEQFGLLFDFAETPGVVQGPPLVPGQDTRAILHELGYDDTRIDELAEAKAILDWRP